MNKVLLVDDESYILDLMQQLIPWEFYGFQIVGIAENAAEAMKIFHKEQPDLIITDICMENISGIEFITRIRMQNHAAKIIILSAYDKFEYAQKALKLDVDGYLLKPINKEELVNTILEVQKKMNTQSTYQNQIVSLQNSLNHFQKKYLERQLLGIYREEQNKIPRELDVPGFWCVISIRTMIRNDIVFLEHDIAGYQGLVGFVLFVDDGLFSVLIHGSPNETEQMKEALKQIKSKYCEEEKSFLCGVSYQESTDLHQICRYSREALNWLFYEGNSYYFENIARKKYVALSLPKKLEKEQFLLLLVNQEKEKCLQYFDNFLKQCQEMNVPQSFVTAHFCQCIDFMKSCIHDTVALQTMEEIRSKASAAIRKQEIADCFLECLNLVVTDKTAFHKAGAVIANAQEYIRNNCFDESFSIETLAEHLNISKSYLSKLYKNETEESLWNFVIRVRIAKAKEMLVNTNATNFAIAKTIGYSSEYHFSRAFSKSVGVSPSTYKKMYMQIK